MTRRVAAFRNRLAGRLFYAIATDSYGERFRNDHIDAVRYRAHMRRVNLGFVKCVEQIDA